jgi:uncharacterized phage-associated protein
MEKNSKVAFDSVHTVARYLFSLKEDLSPLKLQFSLYFLYAYYGAIVKSQKDNGFKRNYPDRLFDSNFEAWKYGCHIKEVYEMYKKGGYNDTTERKMAVKEVKKQKHIKKMIDELFHQIDSYNDFTLLDRNHMDRCWKEAYLSDTKEIDNEQIVEEYIEKYV